MSTAKITAVLGKGRYKIIINQDITHITESITKATEAINKLTKDIETAEPLLEDADDAYHASMAALQTAINAFKADPTDTTRAATQAAVRTSLDKEKEWLTQRSALSENRLHLLAAQKQKTAMETLKTGITTAEREAWAVDLKTDLTVGQTVGITEINGETGKINIAAQGTATTGKVTPVRAATPHQAFVGETLRPGWQKWRPTYRYGVITAIDYTKHTCAITLDAAASTSKRPKTKDVAGVVTDPKGFDVNKETSLKDVPITYMTCNSRAFAIDDHVVIQFQDQSWSKPVVVGFVDNPIGCGITVQLRFLSAVAGSAFLNWCTFRIGEIDRYIGYMDYLAETFIPQVTAKIGEMARCIKGYLFGIPIFYSAEDISAMQKPWNDFVSKEYPTWKAEVQKVRTQWSAVSSAAAYFATHFKGSITGCLDEADNQTAVALVNYIMTIGCCPTELEKPVTTGLETHQALYQLDQFAYAMEAEAAEICSPYTEIYLQVPSLVSFSGTIRGAINSKKQKVYAYTSDLLGYIYGVDGGWIEGLQWAFKISDAKDQNVLQYPNQTDYVIAEMDLPEIGENIDTTITFGLTGRVMTVPSKFGASVPAWNVDPRTGTYYGDLITYEDGYSFVQLCLLFQGGMFYDPISRNPWGSGSGGYGLVEQ